MDASVTGHVESPAPDQSPLRRLVYGEYPPIGTGTAADGDWELHALFDEAYGLAFWLKFLPRPVAGRQRGGGGGVGVYLATDEDPLVLSMSLRGPWSTNYWVGRLASEQDVVAVELTLTDGSTVNATVVAGDLPVKLFVGVTDQTAVPIRFRATAAGAELAFLEIDEHWPGDATELWGDSDDEPDDPDTGFRPEA